jgi:hypothetical protein
MVYWLQREGVGLCCVIFAEHFVNGPSLNRPFLMTSLVKAESQDVVQSKNMHRQLLRYVLAGTDLICIFILQTDYRYHRIQLIPALADPACGSSTLSNHSQSTRHP